MNKRFALIVACCLAGSMMACNESVEWKASNPCPSEGTKQCQDKDLMVCAADGTWVKEKTCEGDTPVCDAAKHECVAATVTTECTVAADCKRDNATATCSADGKCLYTCKDGYEDKNGACVAKAVKCTVGEKELNVGDAVCDADGNLKICQTDGTAKTVECVNNTVCDAAAVTAKACTPIMCDTLKVGEKKCDNNKIMVCGAGDASSAVGKLTEEKTCDTAKKESCVASDGDVVCKVLSSDDCADVSLADGASKCDGTKIVSCAKGKSSTEDCPAPTSNGKASCSTVETKPTCGIVCDDGYVATEASETAPAACVKKGSEGTKCDPATDTTICDPDTAKFNQCNSLGYWGAMTDCSEFKGMKADNVKKYACSDDKKACIVSACVDDSYTIAEDKLSCIPADTCENNTSRCVENAVVVCFDGVWNTEYSTKCDKFASSATVKSATCKEAAGTATCVLECEDGYVVDPTGFKCIPSTTPTTCVDNELKCVDENKYKLCIDNSWEEDTVGLGLKCVDDRFVCVTEGESCIEGAYVICEVGPEGAISEVEDCPKKTDGKTSCSVDLGCYDPTTTKTCEGGVGVGETRCKDDNKTLETCRDDGTFRSEECPTDKPVCGKVDGKAACIEAGDSVICEKGKFQCNDKKLEKCNDAGTAYEEVYTCGTTVGDHTLDPVCDAEFGACVACLSNKDCSGDTPVCATNPSHAADNECVAGKVEDCEAGQWSCTADNILQKCAQSGEGNIYDYYCGQNKNGEDLTSKPICNAEKMECEANPISGGTFTPITLSITATPSTADCTSTFKAKDPNVNKCNYDSSTKTVTVDYQNGTKIVIVASSFASTGFNIKTINDNSINVTNLSGASNVEIEYAIGSANENVISINDDKGGTADLTTKQKVTSPTIFSYTLSSGATSVEFKKSKGSNAYMISKLNVK